VQTRKLLVAEIADARQWVQLRLKQDFVRVDIADAGDACLVRQGGFERRSPRAKGGNKRV
jgi:hypothetical protein